MSLISEFFQPQLNVGASVIGPLVCLVVFSYMINKSEEKNRILALIMMVLFIGLVLICIALERTVGIIWFPSENLQILVWWLWGAIYLATFGALGTAMV